MSNTIGGTIPGQRPAAAPGLEHSERPWGQYQVLSDGSDCKVKWIQVAAGQRLSYQRHQHRAEHWFIVSGTPTVLLDGQERQLAPGDSVDVPVGAAHRITNPTDQPVVFIEVQVGSYFGEDDIERLEDDYGREG